MGLLLALSINCLPANHLSASQLFSNTINSNSEVPFSKNLYDESDHIVDTRSETDANVFGHVLDANTKEHLPYVTIQLKGTTVGTTTDVSGHYFIKNLPIGQFTILAQHVGYETLEKEVILKEHKTIELNFELKPALLSLDEVVVSANRNETSRKMAPSLVTILDMETLEFTNSHLSQGLKFQPGLRVENNCQNCGFTQVRINGLEGPTTDTYKLSPCSGSTGRCLRIGADPCQYDRAGRSDERRGSALFGSSSAIGGSSTS